MQASHVVQAGGLGEPEARDRLHQFDGAAQGQHVGDEQVDDEGLQTDAVLQRTGHVVGELPLGPGPAGGAFLDLGFDARFDDLEDDVVQYATLPVEGGCVREVGTAGSAGLDSDRLLDGGLAQTGAGLQVRLRALAACASARSGLVLIGLRRREAGVLRPLAGGPLQQDGDQDVQQGDEEADHGIDFSGHLAVRAQRLDAGLRVFELPAQRCRVHRRHHSASTAMIAETTARRSPCGIFR